MAIDKGISVIVPFFNEVENIKELHSKLTAVLKNLNMPSEIIFVDDGSKDGSFEVMKNLSPLIALRLRKNYGQSAALDAGIKKSCGEIVITMDGDLENDPEDIPLLLNKLEEGYDVVSGWRKNRWLKQKFSRRIPSLAANRLISLISRVNLHDHGCTLKAYRREILNHLRLQGERHRLITAYAAIMGANIAEMPVKYSPRKYGSSKYGPLRIFKVLLDVFALMFFNKYANRPMHFFGGMGFASFLLSIIAFLGMLYFKFFLKISFIQTPLPTLVVLFAIIGFQFVLMGLLAEIFIQKNNSQEERNNIIKEEIINS